MKIDELIDKLVGIRSDHGPEAECQLWGGKLDVYHPVNGARYCSVDNSVIIMEDPSRVCQVVC